MDGAWLGSVDIAIKKAKTATFFQMNTEDIGALSQPGGSLFNIEHSNNGLITFPGGIPLRYSTVQYSTVQQSKVHHSTVHQSIVQHSTTYQHHSTCTTKPTEGSLISQ